MSLKLISVLAVLALVSVGDFVTGRFAGRWKQRGMGTAPGCRRRGIGRGPQPAEPGSHFEWSMTGQDNDELSLTFQEGAFVPENMSMVHIYPKDRSQRAVGLVPSRRTYDFSTSEAMVAIRQGKFGRGPCILVSADVSTYEDMINMLTYKNGSTNNVPEQGETMELVASLVTDQSQVSQSLRDICSTDKCGRIVQPVIYTTEVATADNEGDNDADDAAADFIPDVLLLNTRISISGLPAPRWHRRRHGGPNRRRGQQGVDRHERRRHHRHHRRQHRRGGAVTADADADTDADADAETAPSSSREDRRWHRRQERRENRRQQRRQDRRNGRRGRG